MKIMNLVFVVGFLYKQYFPQLMGNSLQEKLIIFATKFKV